MMKAMRSICAFSTGLVCAFAALNFASVTPASAYECLDGLSKVPFDTSNNCLAQPDIDRVFGSQIIRWGNTNYMFVNIGNEISIFDISNPAAPNRTTTSRFNVPNVGDSDYDLLNFTVTDDGRYGLAFFMAGTMLFDLGTGNSPSFNDKQFYSGAASVQGGFTFTHGGQQYLIAANIGNGCEGGASGLYEFNGIQEKDVQYLDCVGSSGLQIVNGIQLGDYLYLGNSSQHVLVFKINDLYSTITLDYQGNPFSAYMILDKALAIDTAHRVAVQTDTKGMHIWDLSSPGSPRLKAEVAGSWNRAAVAYPFAYVAKKGKLESERTFNISNLSSPVEIDRAFWLRDNPFTYYDHGCVDPQAGAISPDGSTLYLLRYSKFQLVDVSTCGGPAAPTAAIDVNPSPAFPADTVTIKNQSAGEIDRGAIWVTESADPNGQVVFGSDVLSSTNPTQLAVVIDRDILAGVSFWAHVAVENNEYPYSASGATPDQIATQAISIDRSPQVLKINLNPAAPITGDPQAADPVTLTPVVEGEPASPTGGQIYDWLIKPPTGEPIAYEGAPINVEFDESGTWAITLTTHYEHEVEGGNGDPVVPYDAVYSRDLKISSVFADFSITPSSPLNTEPFTLKSTSTLGAGVVPSYQWTIAGATNYSGCPNSATCTVPADTLNDGNHTITLRVTNTENGDWSEIEQDVYVTDGNIQLDFSWSPTDPEIGDTITFDVEGVNDPLDSATWDFGDTTCSDSGYTRTYVCDPNDPYSFECKKAGYQYSDGGNKTVKLSIVVAGKTYGPVSHTVSVANTGSCDGGGGGTTCSYSLSSTSTSIGGQGGTGQFNVNTQTGCTWSATSQNTWITITSGTSGSGGGTVRFSVDTNVGAARTGTLRAAGYTFTVYQAAGECTYSLSNLQEKFDAAGGSGSVTVNTISGCSWTAASQAGWITVTSGSSGTGNGVVNFNVTKNPYPSERSGTMLIAKNTFTVTEGPLVDTDFTISAPQPDIGEEVTFTVAQGLTPVRWHFGDKNCEGDSPIKQCGSPPSADCYSVDWSFTSAGTVQVFLETTTGEKYKTVWVQPEGECPIPCLADTRPDASFTINPNPAMVGEQVTFTDTSGGGASKASAAISFTWDPINPEIGEGVEFDVTGVGGVEWVQWDFGEEGCSGFPQVYTCTPLYTDCLAYAHKFRSGGSKTVKLTVKPTGSGQVGPITRTVDVQNTGSCSGGGGGGCTYSITPTVKNFSETGGIGSVSVSTQSGCSWTTSNPENWISITSGSSGSGSGTVEYAVAANETAFFRSANLTIAGKNHTVTQNAGGGGGGCSYAITPSSKSFSAGGGSGSITVSTEAGCQWSVNNPVAWIGITSGATGSGPGTVEYSVATNESGLDRSANLTVGGRIHSVNQSGSGALNNEPTEWHWELYKDSELIVEAFIQNPKYTFTEAGTYEIRLTAGNCRGTDTEVQYLQVDPPPIPEPEDFIVPAAVHAPGLNGTMWKTDLRLFNPSNDSVKVEIEYLPEATNNAGGFLFGTTIQLPGKATRVFPDIVDAIPGIQGDVNKGSLRIRFMDSVGGQPAVKPLIMSRTYNETAAGTFGQFVPAVPVLPNEEGKLYLTGLVENMYYRTNVGLANFGAEDAWVLLTVLDKDGNELGQVGKTVPGFSTYQVTQVAAAVGLQNAVDIFSLEVNTYDADMSIYASMVDNVTGDPVLYSAYSLKDEVVYVPGIAHLAGLNNSEWRSDMSFFNPTGLELEAHVEYIPSEEISDRPYMNFMGMGSGKAYLFNDILGSLMSADSKGYIIVRGLNGSLVPQIAARTYSKDATAGTFGQNLKVFCAEDLLDEGESGFIAGVVNSSDPSSGFRTNLGLLNTDEQHWMEVEVSIYGGSGEVLALLDDRFLAPGEFMQTNLFAWAGLGGQDIDQASVRIEVVAGDGLAAYASQVDNTTQDPVLIPAQIVAME